MVIVANVLMALQIDYAKHLLLLVPPILAKIVLLALYLVVAVTLEIAKPVNLMIIHALQLHAIIPPLAQMVSIVMTVIVATMAIQE